MLCDKVLCPPTNCSHAVIPRGQCCAICEGSNVFGSFEQLQTVITVKNPVIFIM